MQHATKPAGAFKAIDPGQDPHGQFERYKSVVVILDQAEDSEYEGHVHSDYPDPGISRPALEALIDSLPSNIRIRVMSVPFEAQPNDLVRKPAMRST